jgi:hypothetical protein
MARNRKNKDRLTQDDLLVIERSVRRELAKESGYYDGRNRPAVYVDRKKRASKQACRGRVDW